MEADALRLRGEVAASQMERQVLERQLALLRRERIPSPTLSAFVERDGFAENVIGLGLSIPLPLPAPIGRTRAGEIAETIARIRAAESSVELVRRRVRLEVASALADLRAKEGTRRLYDEDLLARARAHLVALRDAFSSRQITFREGLVVQRSLIEVLEASIGARLAHAEAVVEVRRVAGQSLLPPSGGPR